MPFSTHQHRLIRQYTLTLLTLIALLVFNTALSAEDKTKTAKAVDATATGEYLGAKSTEMPSWFYTSFMDLNEDINTAKESGKHLILYFYQDGCPYCNKLVNDVLSHSEITSTLKQQFLLLPVNLWGDNEVTDTDGKTYTEKTFAQHLKVQFTPTLLFYSDTGTAVVRLNGLIKQQDFSSTLDYIRHKTYLDTPFADYVETVLTERRSLTEANSTAILPPGFAKSLMQPPLSLSEGKPTAVFFERQNCTNCNDLYDLFKDQQTLKQYQRLQLIRLLVDDSEQKIRVNGNSINAKEWAKVLKIQHYPSIVFFDKDGTEVFRSEANFRRFHTQSMADYVASKAYLHQTEFQRYLEERGEKIRATGTSTDIWSK